jgi:hypothetical protein
MNSIPSLQMGPSGVVDTKECSDMSNDMICFLND